MKQWRMQECRPGERSVARSTPLVCIQLLTIVASDNSSDTELRDALEKGFEISISLVVIFALAILGIIALIIACYFMAKRMHKEFDTPSPDKLVLLKDNKHRLLPTTIQESCRNIIKLIPARTVNAEYDQEAIDKLLNEIRDQDHETEELKHEETEFILGARDRGTLRIRKFSRLHFLEHATDLHISKLEDFYGNRILLSMAPLRKQFVDQWEAIWRQGVGVVVWIGPFVEHKEKIMEPYAAMQENEAVKHGPFTITTVYCQKRQTFDTCRVIVERLGLVEKRKVVLFYAPNWPQTSVSWSLQKDVELLSAVKSEHVAQIGASLPVMLFQCRFGTAGSATLLATYIGYQMWMRYGQTNLRGILQYIRRNRWMAFEQTGDPMATFLTQVQIAYTIMYGVAKWHETGKVSQCENWIRNVLVERAAATTESTISSSKTPSPAAPSSSKKLPRVV